MPYRIRRDSTKLTKTLIEVKLLERTALLSILISDGAISSKDFKAIARRLGSFDVLTVVRICTIVAILVLS
jgi:hypothetical protein